MPEAYNKSYVIDAASIKKDCYELLARSGYQFFHTPNFGMMGKTRKNHTFNPHTKNGVDAAKADREAISFGEFLKLYDENGNDDLESPFWINPSGKDAPRVF